MQKSDTEIHSLGECLYDSPLDIPQFIDEGNRVIVDVELDKIENAYKRDELLSFENAGPRKIIFFNPLKTTAAIVTCGGLCPGLNNVIQSIVNHLYFQYGVKKILGVQYGYEGLIPSYGHAFIELTPDYVEDFHEKGGTMLASSRGMQDVPAMVDTLVKNKIDILFTIGGDGTMRGADAMHKEIIRRGLKISIAGIPKTIDNDISFVDRTFGFSTAVTIANTAAQAAHAEAKGARNGIGLLKLMGRDSGFIAVYTALASNEANYVFIPEIGIKLSGENSFLEHLHNRLKRRGHAVIIVAEGAGQDYFKDNKQFDASGNIKYGDIGLFLKDEINKYFKQIDFHINLKYIDPSYMIRSMPASADDAVFCIMLAQNAVHGAMAGKSGFLVGRWNNYFTFIPFKLATEKRKKIDPKGYLWSILKSSTGQPDFY
ncbi:MAG: ATP-dependent 6-phosphofructokinase [Spirochaetota bacterium]